MFISYIYFGIFRLKYDCVPTSFERAIGHQDIGNTRGNLIISCHIKHNRTISFPHFSQLFS